MKLKYAVWSLVLATGGVSSIVQASGVEPFFGIETSYNLTNPKYETFGAGIGDREDVVMDKEISPGFYAGAVLSEHHRVKLGYMDKGFGGIDVSRYYTAYDYLFNLSERFNLTAGVMAGYDDFGANDEFSGMAAGAQIGAEYRVREFSVELGYQVSANLYESEEHFVANPDFNGNGFAGSSGTDRFAEDNMLYLRLNYYFNGER